MVVDRRKDVTVNQIVISSLNGEPFVKRFTKDNNQIVLRAENKKYAPRYVMEGDQFDVWGVVTNSIRRLLHA
jgi:DNA polymerase V